MEGSDVLITNVRTLIEAIRTHEAWAASEVLFRGHSNERYKLEPSLFRNESWLVNESAMIRDVISEHPNEFRNDITMLDKLVRLQHYGLPTRLLDVTTNALVALYFAVEGEENYNKDGAVLVLSSQSGKRTNYFDGVEASILANLSNLDLREKKWFEGIINKRWFDSFEDEELKLFNSHRYAEKLKRFVMNDNPIFNGHLNPKDTARFLYLSPKKDNQRIVAQSGAFIICGAPLYYGNGKNRFYSFFDVSKFIIPSKSKALILDELKLLGIARNRIYPEIENTSKYIKDKYSVAI